MLLKIVGCPKVPQKAAKGGENSNRFEGDAKRGASIILATAGGLGPPLRRRSVEVYATRRPGFGLYGRFAKHSPPAWLVLPPNSGGAMSTIVSVGDAEAVLRWVVISGALCVVLASADHAYGDGGDDPEAAAAAVSRCHVASSTTSCRYAA